MSDEITRYDMSIEWGSMCGCEVVYVSDGEYVRYADYAALRAQLTTAERERDEARRERDAVRKQYAMSLEEQVELVRQREDTSSQLWDCMNERDGWKHRAERAERVVEAAREWLADLWRGDMNGTVIGVCMEYEPDGQYALWEQVAPIAEAVRALDATPTPGDA